MGVRVPLARRQLLDDGRRAALSVGGVAAALLLVLVLQGIVVGAMAQVTRYIDRLPAAVIVSQDGVGTMHMSSSALPLDTVDKVAAVPGVAWAEPIRYTSAVVTGPGADRQLAYVLGYDPTTSRGGPAEMVRGRAPGPGEGVLDVLAADQLGVDVGDEVRVSGLPVRLSGISRGGTSMVNTTLFVRFDDMDARQPDAVSYVLVGTAPDLSAPALRDRIATVLPGTMVQTRTGFAASEAAIVSDMTADLMRIMTVIGLGIALAVVALALFTLTIARQRDHAILKALGVRPQRLAVMVVAQALQIVAAAVVVAVVLATVVAIAVGAVAPTVEIALLPADIARTAVASTVVGTFGALASLRRIFTVDPASAFRSTT
jgi:putative ABC transport system permease protein